MRIYGVKFNASLYNSSSSEHKGEVVVAESISDVETTIDLRVEAMIGIVAWPELVSNDDNALGSVFLHGPGTLKVVFRNAVEELMVENAFISINQVSLFFAINPAEVHIVSKFESCGATKTLEALISADFMKWCHL